jgi:hypothetical protein
MFGKNADPEAIVALQNIADSNIREYALAVGGADE